MIKNWESKKLGDVASFISRGKSPSYVNKSEIAVLNQRAIRWDFIEEQYLKYHSPAIKIGDDYFIRPGDIVINSTGDITIGRAYFFKKKWKTPLFVDSHVTIIRLKNDIIIPEFLIQLFPLKAYQTKIYNLVTGATGQLELSRSNLSKLEIEIPPLPIQQKIAAILSAYDDLIETNNRRIAILEEMAQQIYKEWFVRMRFPGWESAEFKKGVPLEWEIEAIQKFGKVITGKTPSTKIAEYFGGHIPFIKTPDMHDSIFVFETEDTLTKRGADSQQKQYIPENSICVSCIGTGGVVSITSKLSQTNQQINSLILNNLLDLEFLFFKLSDLKETIQLFGYTGATMTNLSKGKFENLKIIYPNKTLVKYFHKIINPIFAEIKLLLLKNINLRKIRDLLLPRLMSGKLSVDKIEIQANNML